MNRAQHSTNIRPKQKANLTPLKARQAHITKPLRKRVTRRPPRVRSPGDACTRVKRWPLSSTGSKEEARGSSAVGGEKILNDHRIYGFAKNTIDINQSHILRLSEG